MTQVVIPMTKFSWMADTFANEQWTPEKRQYVLSELDKGRIIPEIAKDLHVAPSQLRSALRYYGQHPKNTKPGKKTRKDLINGGENASKTG